MWGRPVCCPPKFYDFILERFYALIIMASYSRFNFLQLYIFPVLKENLRDEVSNGDRHNESGYLQGLPFRSHRRSTCPQDPKTDRYYCESDIYCFVWQVSKEIVDPPKQGGSNNQRCSELHVFRVCIHALCRVAASKLTKIGPST